MNRCLARRLRHQPEFHIESYDAGHILGSSSLVLTITTMEEKRRNLLRRHRPLQPTHPEHPSTPPQTPTCSSANPLMRSRTRTGDQPNPSCRGKSLAKRGGSSSSRFAIGRAQPLCITRQLEDQQRIPRFRLRGQPMASAPRFVCKISRRPRSRIQSRR